MTHPQPTSHRAEASVSRLLELFEGALDHPEADRAAFLDRECVGDSYLPRGVQELPECEPRSSACREGAGEPGRAECGGPNPLVLSPLSA